jgi:hypothetical protein
VSYVRVKGRWVAYPFQSNISALDKDDQVGAWVHGAVREPGGRVPGLRPVAGAGRGGAGDVGQAGGESPAPRQAAVAFKLSARCRLCGPRGEPRGACVRTAGCALPTTHVRNQSDRPGQVACLAGLVEAKVADATAGGRPATFDDWIMRCMGRGIADLFMRPYNFKVGRLGVGGG